MLLLLIILVIFKFLLNFEFLKKFKKSQILIFFSNQRISCTPMRVPLKKLIHLTLAVCIVGAVGESSFVEKSARRTHVNSFVPIQNELMSNDVDPVIREIERPIESAIYVIANRYVNQVFDGPEKSLALLRNYYHSETAVGDPNRSKRTKRISRDAAPLKMLFKK